MIKSEILRRRYPIDPNYKYPPLKKFKCFKTRTWFFLPKLHGLPQGAIVRPFNGEKMPKRFKRGNDVSWSHGLTHFELVATGEVRWCGTHWFEQQAQPITGEAHNV